MVRNRSSHGNETRKPRAKAKPADWVAFHMYMSAEMRAKLEAAAHESPLRTSSALVRQLISSFVDG